ncbi:tRNA uridine 5-carboxymethylaminomethyl modification enzyme MnmG [Oxobacter pfennigii]|uniref:tRNA uridine 5-carboxymethylaminomethyl modification enzyme MnmG n=1 Tax=Oxobacter pfennigii TaxID=36849 RepID=A0A0P8Y8C7_9CLOT|nr:tRNA uridine-5-carboxymethylaminomethyl(34) synthesis enzyme MnmG [Oxobacter pfennigii]KPU42950.1 tRNA uridine 5-carboxymethylaminomethyl modification enzyme MnmG [Oxobacter pfennigii]
MSYLAGKYDVIVVGAGHAGCEAALAASRMGCKTLMCTINLDSIAMMPCNPAIGGTAKGHLVREVDALGGEMGVCIDKTFIQSRMLNTAKGPAVHSLRAQADKKAYQFTMKHTLEKQDNLDVKQDEIVKLEIEDGKVKGAYTKNGAYFETKAVILTTGTYLKGRIIIGEVSYNGGPNGLFAANELSDDLVKHGVLLKRFKTGTPARINRRSVDFSKMLIQPGDEIITPFSFMSGEINREQIACYLTYTNENTHEIIRKNIHRSPLYSGDIQGVGPRYCPSIESKIMMFPDKKNHQIFIEPEGKDTEEMYVQGMSSSLPEDVQIEFLRTVPGLENVQMMRTAYAIEYDCIDPTQLKISLEMKSIDSLFCAGQINGSSGYEEAAAQGIVAGINAALKIKNKEPMILDRSEAYIGVLIDDLVTKGTDEPYRMMTSRAEYRLILRQDNADMRLTKIGYNAGLVTEERYQRYLKRHEDINSEIERLMSVFITPTVNVVEFLNSLQSAEIKSGIKLSELLKRPELNYENTKPIDVNRPDVEKSVKEEVEILIKYEGYIKRQLMQAEQFKKMENKKLSEDIDYRNIAGLRLEAREKLDSIKPSSVGQASRISGVSPADISVLLIYLEQIKRR